MFVLVKQESFATVSVGILKLLFPVLLLEWGDKWFEVFVYMKVICSGLISNMFSFLFFLFFFFNYYCECSVVESGDFMVTLCCLCCSAKACLNVFSDWRFELPPEGCCWFWTEGSPRMWPPETYAPCPLALHYDRAQTHEREVVANGRRGQGSYLSRNGFSTAVHRSLHEHMTNNHYTELRYDIISWYSLWCFLLFSFFQPILILASSCLSFNKHLLYSRNISCCLLHQSCWGANKTQLSLSHVCHNVTNMEYERQYKATPFDSWRDHYEYIWEISPLNPGQLLFRQI